MSDGFEVDVLALRQAADGIGRTVEAVHARPLDGGAGPDVGHDRLADATAEFLARWRRGVETLAEDGTTLASSLLAAVRAYERVDTQGRHALTGPAPAPR